MITPVISAAGYGQIPEGSPKILAELAPDRTIIGTLVDTIYSAGMNEAIFVLNRDNVHKVQPYLPSDARVVIQEKRMGTAPAVKLALKHANKAHVMSFFADMPLWRPETLLEFAKHHIISGKKMSLISIPEEIWAENEKRKYGRIAKDINGDILGIFEHENDFPDATHVTAVNPSLFCFSRPCLMAAIRSINQVTAKGEKTINSAINHFLGNGGVNEFILKDSTEAFGVNDFEQLISVRKVFQERQQLAVAS